MLRVEIVRDDGTVKRVIGLPDPREQFCQEFNSINAGTLSARPVRSDCGRAIAGRCRLCKPCAHVLQPT